MPAKRAQPKGNDEGSGSAAPKRARGSKSKANDDEDELVRRLAARLTRAELEALVVANVRSGAAAITRAELEARLPERLQSRDVQRVKVRTGESRTGTGWFDALDDVLLVGILARLEPTARVRAVTRVCKSWRGLRGCAELFTDLTEYMMTVRRIEGFLTWLPHKGKEVLKLSLRADKETHAKVPPTLLAKFTSLTDLTLTGPKITANALAAAASACGAQLKRFELYDVKCSDATHLKPAALAAAVKQFPLLEALSVPGELLHSFGVFSRETADAGSNPIFRALSEARSGGVPVLRELRVGTHFSIGSARHEWLQGVGGALPELEVLHAHNLDFNGSRFGEVRVGAARAWAPLPRLRELELVARRDFSGNGRGLISSQHLGEVLGLAFDAAPGLERFVFDGGTQYVSGRDRKAGVTPQPHPALAGALQAHPPPYSLRELSLRHVNVAVADLEALDLPNLRRLTLRDCGPHAAEAFQKLAANYPPGELKSGELRSGAYGW